MGKLWREKFLANHTYKVIGIEKFDEYGKVNKYAKYNCAILINIEEENLVEWLILMIHQICQYFSLPKFSHVW